MQKVSFTEPDAAIPSLSHLNQRVFVSAILQETEKPSLLIYEEQRDLDFMELVIF